MTSIEVAIYLIPSSVAQVIRGRGVASKEKTTGCIPQNNTPQPKVIKLWCLGGALGSARITENL